MQHRYPGLVCDLLEGVFDVTNPVPKPGALRLLRRAAKRHHVGVIDVARDALAAGRMFR